MPRIACACTLVLGTLLIVLVPPMAGFDESGHFWRTWQVSIGDFFPERDAQHAGMAWVPRDVDLDLQTMSSKFTLSGEARAKWLQFLRERAPSGSDVQVRVGALSGYSPLPYLPGAAAMWVGRQAGFSARTLVYLCRAANLLTYVALLGVALARGRRAKWLLAVAALLPVGLLGAATVSCDGVTYGLLLVVIGCTVRAGSSNERWRRADTVVAGVTALALGVAKPPYAIAALLLIGAARHFRGRRRLVLVAAGLAGPATMLAWTKFFEKPLALQDIAFGTITATDRFAPYTNVHPSEQFTSNVIGDPIGFVRVLGRTFGAFGLDWLRDAPAQFSLQHTTPWGVALLAGCALLLVARSTPKLTNGPGAVAWALTAVAMLGATLVGAYLSWNALGSPRIEAYQGRYLVACLPLLAVALSGGRERIAVRTAGIVSMALVSAAVVWFGVNAAVVYG